MKVELHDELVIGKGLNRTVYFHPQNPDHCIKILHRQEKWSHSENEIDYLKKVQNWKNTPGELYPRYIEEVETSLGRGRTFQLIRDEGSGQVSLNLEQYVESIGDAPLKVQSLQTAFKEMMKKLYKARLVGRDIHPANICVQQRKSGIILYVVDGLGHNAFIPLLDWVGYLRAKHHEKHFAKIRAYIEGLNSV